MLKIIFYMYENARVQSKTAANCFSRMLSQRELIKYIYFCFMYIFTCLRILFLVASSNDESRKVHNEVLHNNYYYYEIKSIMSV